MRQEIISVCSLCALAGLCEQLAGNGRLSKTVRFLLGMEFAISICGWFLELKDVILEVLS